MFFGAAATFADMVVGIMQPYPDCGSEVLKYNTTHWKAPFFNLSAFKTKKHFYVETKYGKFQARKIRDQKFNNTVIK